MCPIIASKFGASILGRPLPSLHRLPGETSCTHLQKMCHITIYHGASVQASKPVKQASAMHASIVLNCTSPSVAEQCDSLVAVQPCNAACQGSVRQKILHAKASDNIIRSALQHCAEGSHAPSMRLSLCLVARTLGSMSAAGAKWLRYAFCASGIATPQPTSPSADSGHIVIDGSQARPEACGCCSKDKLQGRLHVVSYTTLPGSPPDGTASSPVQGSARRTSQAHACTGAAGLPVIVSCWLLVGEPATPMLSALMGLPQPLLSVLRRRHRLPEVKPPVEMAGRNWAGWSMETAGSKDHLMSTPNRNIQLWTPPPVAPRALPKADRGQRRAVTRHGSRTGSESARTVHGS